MEIQPTLTVQLSLFVEVEDDDGLRCRVLRRINFSAEVTLRAVRTTLRQRSFLRQRGSLVGGF